jgi:hypothetical protein
MDVQPIICPNCQTPNPAKNLYCQACGKPLVTTPQQPTTPTVVSAPEPEPVPQQPALEAPPPPPANQPPFVEQDQKAAPFPPYPANQLDQTLPPPQSFPPPGYQGQPYQPQEVPPQGYPQQGMPPQQGYYPPPLPSAHSLDGLGVRVDHWAGLIPGGAEKCTEVEENIATELKAREFPMVNVERAEFGDGMVKKAYQVVRGPAGSVAVHTSAMGKDLLISWSTHVRRSPNWPMIAILAAIAFGISFLTSLGGIGNFGYFLVNWIFGTFNWLLPVTLLALIAGYVWKGNLWYFFMTGPSEMAKDELVALAMSVHNSLMSAAQKAGLEVDQLPEKRRFQAE